MAIEENELLKAQAVIEARRLELKIPINGKPKSVEPIGLKILEEAVAATQACKSTPGKITPDQDQATQSPIQSKERDSKSNKTGKSWGMLFLSLVETPEFCALRARELHVLSVLIAFRNNRNGGKCAPGRKKIEALTGFASRTIDRSLSELINRGIIRQETRAHVGQNAVFLVAENGEDIARNLEVLARH